MGPLRPHPSNGDPDGRNEAQPAPICSHSCPPSTQGQKPDKFTHVLILGYTLFCCSSMGGHGQRASKAAVVRVGLPYGSLSRPLLFHQPTSEHLSHFSKPPLPSSSPYLGAHKALVIPRSSGFSEGPFNMNARPKGMGF